MASALTAQSAFLNKFENVVNRRVDIREDIKRYQDTLSYASSKVDYSSGENLYMLPSNMNLQIKTGTIRYNNKILVSDGKFNLGKNDKVNAGSTKPEEETTKKTTTIHKDSNVIRQKQIITHKEERAPLILFLTGGFTIWFMFQQTEILCTVVHKIVSAPNMSYQILYIGFNHQLVSASIHLNLKWSNKNSDWYPDLVKKSSIFSSRSVLYLGLGSAGNSS